MRGAIIGFGTIATGHTAAYCLNKEVSIVAVVDPLPERRWVASQTIPGVNTYEDIDHLFQEETLEFLDICSPPHTHFSYVYAALENNCHVMCEKPFLLSPKEYRVVSSLANSRNRIAYPAHNYKFSPAAQIMHKLTWSGEIGDLVQAHFRTLRSGHAHGVPEWNPDWRRDRSIGGGGILFDHGPHSIYLPSYICGRFPLRVSCISGNLKADEYQDTEDTVFLTLDFGNMLWRIDLSWASGFRNTYYSVTGTAGSILITDDEVCIIRNHGYFSRETIHSDFNDPTHKSWFQSVLSDFLEKTGHCKYSTELLKEALVTSLVIESAYSSANQMGISIALPDWREYVDG
jgi:predicted dehydrogenase